MNRSDDRLTILLFRGVTGNPLRISVRNATVKRMLLAVVILLTVQVGILVHYVVQTNRVSELEGVKKELRVSRGQTVEFSEAVDEMQRRILTIQALNEKLQVMFGLEPEPGEGVDVKGQGGPEVPYEVSPEGGTEASDFTSLGKEPSRSRLAGLGKQTRAQDFDLRKEVVGGATMAMKIRRGLSRLEQQTVQQQRILAKLEKAAEERVGRWAATPSVWPVKGPVTSKFGPRISPFTGKRAFHAGLDIGAPRGEKVRAPAKGRVAVAAYDTRMGNFVRINHRHGIETTYGHLSKVLVRYGQEVKRGEVLGLVGSTGRFSTGPHLHYQIAVNDKAVDPLQYILD